MLQRIVEAESPCAFEASGLVLPALHLWNGLHALKQRQHQCQQQQQGQQQQFSKASSGVKGASSSRGVHRHAGASKYKYGSIPHEEEASLALASGKGVFAVGEQAQNIGAGAAARTLSQMVIHPLDTIKTRLQVTAKVPELIAWQQAAAKTGGHLRAGTARLSMKQGGRGVLMASRGVGDLYLGLASAVITTLPAAAVFFATSEACKRVMERRFKCERRGMACHMVSSSTAAVASALIRVPGDVLKHRIQAYLLPNNVFVGARQVLSTHGIRGMYVGFGVTLFRDVPEIAMQFTVYDALLRLQQQASEQQAQQQPSQQHAKMLKAARHPLFLGGVAGAAASAATTPLDVIKTQLQCDGVSNAGMAIKSVLARKGPLGFCAGMGPRVMQATLMSAVFFTCYERLKHDFASTCEQQSRKLQQQQQEQQQKLQYRLQQQQRRLALVLDSSSASSSSSTLSSLDLAKQRSEDLLFDLCMPLDASPSLFVTSKPRRS